MCRECGLDEEKGRCTCGAFIRPTYPGANRERDPADLEDEREEEHYRIMERASTLMPRFFKP